MFESDDETDADMEALLIVAMRIYDVQMALLTHVSPKAAGKLGELHKSGIIVAGVPAFSAENTNKFLEMMAGNDKG